MQKFLAFFLVLFFSKAISQTYHFDVMTNYSYKYNSFKRDGVTFGSSKTNDYLLSIYRKNKTYKAIIYDFKTNRKHNFSVSNFTDNNENTFTFVYINSAKYEGFRTGNGEYTFKILKTDKDSILELKIFKNAQNYNDKQRLILFVKQNPINLFPMFQCICFHPFEHKKIEVPFNFLVISSKYEDKTVCKLLDIQTIDTTLAVPE